MFKTVTVNCLPGFKTVTVPTVRHGRVVQRLQLHLPTGRLYRLSNGTQGTLTHARTHAHAYTWLCMHPLALSVYISLYFLYISWLYIFMHIYIFILPCIYEYLSSTYIYFMPYIYIYTYIFFIFICKLFPSFLDKKLWWIMGGRRSAMYVLPPIFHP